MSSPSSVMDDDVRIRSKLLYRLGINNSIGAPPPMVSTSPPQYQAPLSAAQLRRHRILRGMGVGTTLPTCPPDGSAIRPPLDGAKPFCEPLKWGYSRRSATNKNNNNSEKKKIHFENMVYVIPIPTRYEYSDRIKRRIWSNRHELAENAERNALEFAAEGWNWRNVTEDEGMYICSVSGELVHPIHLQHQQQQAMEEEYNSNDNNDEDEGPPRRGLERGQPVHSS